VPIQIAQSIDAFQYLTVIFGNNRITVKKDHMPEREIFCQFLPLPDIFEHLSDPRVLAQKEFHLFCLFIRLNEIFLD